MNIINESYALAVGLRSISRRLLESYMDADEAAGEIVKVVGMDGLDFIARKYGYVKPDDDEAGKQ